MPEQDCLLVKTASEIALKSDFVRRFFTKKLVQSIKFALKANGLHFTAIERGGGRLYVFTDKPAKAQAVLSKIPGIHATALAERFKDTDYENLEARAVAFSRKLLKKGDSFALSVNASNNKDFSGKDLENRIGNAVMKEIPGLTVNLSSPGKKIFIEVRKHEFFVYNSQERGLGGLPIGVEGSVAMPFSGKKDELLAAFLLMHRGCNVFPIASKKILAVKKMLKMLEPFNGCRKFELKGEKDLPQLVEKRNIRAIATADSRVDEKSLALYKKFDAAQQLVVLRPLLLFPEERKKEIERLLY